MKFLGTAIQINNTFAKLFGEYERVTFATAWASCENPSYATLYRNRAKIEQSVVGTHFYQTDPDFIKAFLRDESVRFVKRTDGVFHPKLYLFHTGKSWSALIGSANFTKGGFHGNQETAVLISDSDDKAGTMRLEIDATLKEYWNRGGTFSQPELDAYRVISTRTRQRLKRAAGAFGKGKLGILAIDTGLIVWSWPEFYHRVREDREHGVDGRLKVLSAAKALFETATHFHEISDAGRKGIAGFSNDPSIGWGWFGSMAGAGAFKKLVNRNSMHLSRALDQISLQGTIRRSQYMAYIDHYLRAYPHGRDGLATATRLLAMKRPDTFVCIDSKNRDELISDLKISLPNKDYENYWDAVIERIRESEWWNSPRPAPETAAAVWDNRVAFLDSIFYKGLGPG